MTPKSLSPQSNSNFGLLTAVGRFCCTSHRRLEASTLAAEVIFPCSSAFSAFPSLRITADVLFMEEPTLSATPPPLPGLQLGVSLGFPGPLCPHERLCPSLGPRFACLSPEALTQAPGQLLCLRLLQRDP